MIDKETPICFVVSPIGDADSEERVHADWFLEGIVRPTLATAAPSFKVVRADTISAPGLIDQQIIAHLLDAELVVADLSFVNANVLYEIGIRHMAQRPIIHLQRNEDRVPFDVSLFRAIKYTRRTPQGMEQGKKDLAAAVDAVLSPGYQVENPITLARGLIELRRHAAPETKVLLDQIQALSSRLEAVEGRRSSSEIILSAARERTETIYVHIERSAEVVDRVKTALADLRATFPVAIKGTLKNDMVEVIVPDSVSKTKGWATWLNEVQQLPGVTSVGQIPF